jgi:tetratricopeptide (TPR) repeat protein
MVTREPLNYANLLHTLIHRATTKATDQHTQTGRDPDESHLLHLLVVALKRPEQWSDARDLLLHLNTAFERDGRYVEWAAVLTRGIEQSKTVGDLDTRAILEVYLGNIYRIQGQLEAGLTVLHRAHAYFEAATASLWYARACNGIARIVQEMGDSEQSRVWAEQALAGLPPYEVNERAVCYRMLGGVAMVQKQWEEAYTRFAQSLALWRKGGDPRLIAFGLTNLSVALRGLGRIAEAEGVLGEAIHNFRMVGDEPNEAVAHISLGNVYLKTERWQEAIRECHLVEQLLLPRQDILRLAGLYNNWGMAFAGLQDWARAIRAYRESIRYGQTVGRRIELANVMDNLAIALYTIGDYSGSASVCREALELLGGDGPQDLHAELISHLMQAETKQSSNTSGM